MKFLKIPKKSQKIFSPNPARIAGANITATKATPKLNNHSCFFLFFTVISLSQVEYSDFPLILRKVIPGIEGTNKYKKKKHQHYIKWSER